jgi:hypothetical protein
MQVGKISLINSTGHSTGGFSIDTSNSFRIKSTITIVLTGPETHMITGTITVCGGEYFSCTTCTTDVTRNYMFTTPAVKDKIIMTKAQLDSAFSVNIVNSDS